MENMNKENFWNGLYEQYPEAVQEFCNFIDKYKIDNNWSLLFGDKIKFHDLPIEMQLGIWMQFQISHSNGDIYFTFNEDCFEIKKLYDWANNWFKNREINLY